MAFRTKWCRRTSLRAGMRVLQRNRPNSIDEDITVDTLLPRKRCIIRMMDTENSLHLNLLSANWTPRGG